MTDPTTPDLLACPFCGGNAGYNKLRNGCYVVECRNDDCAVMPDGVFAADKNKIASEWNTRPAPAPTPPTVQEAAKAERDACAHLARMYAGNYQQGTDGRNTFIILAEQIERNNLDGARLALSEQPPATTAHE